MAQDPNEHLQTKIKQLELEIVEREKDLTVFRRELSQVNKQLESLIGQLSRDIKIAHQIQRVLVPTEFPNIQGIEFSYKFLPSTVQGGDYFDIFEHENKFNFGLILAASKGHGMSAMLLSVLLNISGKMEARKGAEPHKIVQLIYNELEPNLNEDERADLFYALVDRRSFDLHYCLQGDILAVHQCKSTSDLTLLSHKDPSLQLGMTLPNISQKITLLPGDRIVIASPGMYQCKNLEGEVFGKERLFETILKAPQVGVHDLRNEIFINIQKHTGGVEIPRDQSLVVAEVKNRVIKLAK